MSIPARRVCTTIQRRAARSSPKFARASSSHAHDDHHHHEQPHPWTYPKETFTSRPFIVGGAISVLLLGLFEAGALDIRDEKHPITRYMARNIANGESILEDNLERIEIMKERAANFRLESTARQDTFKPARNIGGAAYGSPHGAAVRPTPDMSEITPKKRPKQD